MNKTLNIRLLSFTCLFLAISLAPSCKKDDVKSTGVVQLLSFGPTGAKVGDTLRFIGNNLDKVTGIALTGADVPQSAFLQQTEEVIMVKIPKETVKGFVTLKTPAGDVVSKTMLNISVAAKVTSITPQVRPGENVTITGEYLNWVTRVTFNKDLVVTSFVSQSLTQLVVAVPANAQSGPLVLFYAGTDSMDLQTSDTLKVTLPRALSLSPNPVKHKTDVTITGTDLDLTKKIFFTGVAAPVTIFVSQSATQLVVQVPAATTKGAITFEAASGVQTRSDGDLDVVLPSVATMLPNPIDPGADVTITGSNLDLVTSISFQNAAPVTTFISQTPATIVVKVPAGVLRGKVTLAVLNSTLTVQSADILEINGSVPPPTIAFAIYNDGVTTNWTSSGWIGGGWGGSKDLDNTSPVRDGTKSCKIDYVGGYGSPLQLGGASISMSPYTTFKISIYGAPGSAGKKVNLGINGSDAYTITLVEGKWTDYALPISSLTSSSTLTEILIKEYNGSGGFTIYVDALGLN